MSESYSLDIRSAHKNYSVRIGYGLLEEVIEDPLKIFLVDARLKNLYPSLCRDRAVYVEALENNKTLETVALLIEKLRDQGAQRTSHIVAVGGGIIQDLATFVASSYMRGITWTYCPTTLLGMVDSCIGGKSSINVGKYKNIAGNFYPPENIIVDPVFCQSLPSMQRVEGLCEAVKICYASSDGAFEAYLRLADVHNLIEDIKAQEEIIELSLKTKKVFIEEDEFDHGIRLLLNFGHTFGHAVEAASAFQISHGIAVGLGMIAALHFSEAHGFVQNRNSRIRSLMKHISGLLRQVPDLKAHVQSLSSSLAAEKFISDKKHRDGSFVVIAFNDNGHLERRFVPSTKESLASVERVFESLKSLPL